MDKINYSAEISDLEVLKLRSEVAELKSKLKEAQDILEENGLADVKAKIISSEELISIQQIEILAQLSTKGLPFTTEEVKNFEVLVKTLLAIRGKAPVAVDDKNKKKKPRAKVADLLAIVKNSANE